MNKKYFVIPGLIIAVIFIFFISNYISTKPIDKNASQVVYEVKEGATPTEVFYELKNLGYIKNAKKAMDIFQKNNYTLTANIYSISKSNSLFENIEILSNPISNVQEGQACKVVITEGMLYQDILTVIQGCGNYTYQELDEYFKTVDTLDEYIKKYWFLDESIKSDKIIHPLEGYFAAATYYFTNDASIEEIGIKFLDTTESYLLDYKNNPLLEKYSITQLITLASLVEREAMHEEDRYKIAGVFFNRLEQNMKLQSDITVLYAQNSKEEFVSYDDLETESPYNTYIYEGLMPGPISCVSKSSIDAVFNSEDNDYIYFFANQDTGEVYYSKTLEEHEKISEKYKWE